MKLGVGVIGAGVRGRHSWERQLATLPDIEIKAVSPDSNGTPEMLEGFTVDDARTYAEQLGAHFVQDYRDLLTRDDIHLVSLMVEPGRVPQVGLDVARAGKHFVTDKPIARSAAEARTLVDACRTLDTKTLVTYALRYAPTAQQALASVRSGEIGDPLIVNVELLFHNGPLPGFTATKAYRDAVGGGEVTNFGSYALDIATMLVGRPARRVYAQMANFFYSDYKAADIEDFGVLMIEFEGGCKGHIVTGRTTSKVDGGPTLRIDVTGTRGGFCANGTSESILIHAQDRTGLHFLDVEASTRMLADFINAIKTNGPSPIPIEQGLIVQEILDAAYESARENRWIDV